MADQTPYSLSRRSLMKGLAALGGVVTVPGLLAACASDDDAAPDATIMPPTTGDDPNGALRTLTAGLPGSVATLDVSREAGILNYVIALLCQESLLAIDEGGALVPSLASSWETPDPLTHVFTLLEGVTFSDGTPLTVDDVLASLELHTAADSTSALAYAYVGIDTVEQTGDRELTITLTEPNASFGWTMSPGTFQVHSKAFLDEHGDRIGTPQVLLLGTGPYVVTELVPDSHVSLEANPNWRGGDVEVTQLRLDFIGEESTRQLAMRQGDIGLATNVSLDQVGQWEQIDGVEILTTTDNSLVTLAFNTTIAPFDDIHVRRAVAHCADRTAIVRSLLDDQAIVAATLPTPEQWGGLLEPAEVDALYAGIAQSEFDLEAAAAELTQSASPDGFSATVTYPNIGPQIGTALLSIAENLSSIGVDLEVREITLEQWFEELGAHTSGILVGWYFATTGDPAEYAMMLLNGAFTGEGGTNIADYDEPEVTDLLDRSQQSTDPAERGQLLGDALVRSAEDLPYFPMWWGAAATAFGPGVTTDAYGPYFFIGPWATAIDVA
jgi:peptide/nickel transport system substrate-binding protein